jgi:hypothetical protein
MVGFRAIFAELDDQGANQAAEQENRSSLQDFLTEIRV